MPKIGDALKRAVELKPEEGSADGSRARPAGALMNANRLRIFRYLCALPCSDMGAIASGTGMSRSSASWHVAVLLEAEYIAAFEHDAKTVYCPKGLVSARNMPLFTVLAREDCRALYGAVLARQGSDREALRAASGQGPQKADRCIAALLEAGLVSRIRDGRHARHFPTGRMTEAVAEERRVAKDFIRRLMERLKQEHMRPEVTELKGVGVVITLDALGRAERIEIPFRKAGL